MHLFAVSSGYNNKESTVELTMATPTFSVKFFNIEFCYTVSLPNNYLDLTISIRGRVKAALSAELSTAKSAPLYNPLLNPSSRFVRLKQSKVVVNSLYSLFFVISLASLVLIRSNG